MSTKFRYRSLSSPFSIRLLNILPCPNELKCSLIEARLSDSLEYTALSYCWGARHGTIPLVVTCDDEETTLLITPNLQSFLAQYKTECDDTGVYAHLWIDAVCINQADNEEKNVQIAMMKEIYQKASCTIVWLGEATSQSNAGFDMVPRLLAAENILGSQEKEQKNITTRLEDRQFTKLGLPKLGDSSWAAYSSIFERAWFSRVWVIQEVVMSSQIRIQCGTRSLSWDDFSKAFKFMNKRLVIVVHNNLNTYMAWLARAFGIIDARDRRLEGSKRDLLGILLGFRHYQATDPRDKVFALCGLATDTELNALVFQPDYRLDMSQAYTNLALFVINSERNLDILSVPPKFAKQRNTALPSWVPDWSICDTTPAMLLDRSSLRSEERVLQKASGDSETSAEFDEKGISLGLRGILIDQVKETAPVQMGWHGYEGSLSVNIAHRETQTFLQWEYFAKARSKQTYSYTNEDMLDVYWQTITGGWKHSDDDAARSHYLKWDAYFRPGNSLRKLLGPRIVKSSSYAWVTLAMNAVNQTFRPLVDLGFSDAINVTDYRRLIRSRNGFLGLAPTECRVGDSIVVFEGGRVPLIIRPHGENWELVGESYVHGMMAGEHFDSRKCETIRLV